MLSGARSPELGSRDFPDRSRPVPNGIVTQRFIIFVLHNNNLIIIPACYLSTFFLICNWQPCLKVRSFLKDTRRPSSYYLMGEVNHSTIQKCIGS
jgi:hypothetical protein